MSSQLRLKRLAPLALVSAVAAVFAATTGGATASPEAVKSACKAAKNVEAIIDDSGSMESQDPSKFRTALLDAFANIATNNGLILGGIEFGTSPNTLFGPGTIPGIIPAMRASFAQVDANNGSTDYEEAFAAGVAHNGTADARIFLTDGAPNSYPNSHKNPKIKTYVVGIGDFAASVGGNAVLTQLAAETGGPPPFLISDSTQVQPVAGAISAAINCKKPPLTFTHTFNQQGEQVGYSFKPQGSSADILITWGDSSALLDPRGFSIQGGRGGSAGSSTLASLAKKGKAKLKVKEKKGATFVTVKLKGLKKGKKVKFKVKAKKLTAPTVGTTQIIK